jgi:acyl-CoA reductase-like NAD-dependent aldehyde dehydrogenase
MAKEMHLSDLKG